MHNLLLIQLRALGLAGCRLILSKGKWQSLREKGLGFSNT